MPTPDEAYQKAERRIAKAKRLGRSKLDLSGLGLSVLPESIGQLANLQQLILHSNQLLELPESLGQLASLQTLSIHSNRLSALPESLGQLASLQQLYMSNNQLSALPDSLSQLTSLQKLYVFDNQLLKLSESLGQLVDLRDLLLSGNQLSALPESIGQLANLQVLSLHNNRLSELPESIGQLARLQQLYLHNNPALNLPPEILGPSIEDVDQDVKSANPRAILAYYWQSRSQQSRALNEAKLLLVGQGGVGKTSLVRYLVEDQSCEKGEPPTEGIRRAKWPRPIKPPGKRDAQNVTLNVWDFGGQEIMHATHQFFLTKRSLYLLVLDARTTEAENNLHYWLKVIQSFGGDAPVLVVVNKVEWGVNLELNESRLKKDFAPNLQGFLKVSCETGKGIPALRKAIDDQIRQLGHVFDVLPGSYFRVKERLAELAGKKSYISYNEYKTLCTKSRVSNELSRNQLLRLLHDLGAALNFSDADDPYKLHETNVLDPEWVTDAVYRVITNPILGEARGELKRDQLAALLKNKKKFPPTQHEFIIDLMRKFELCFDFPDSSGDRFLVPERLAKDEPDVGWDEGDPLRFQVKYNVLPPGLVCRFIVKMHTHLKPDTPTYWRDGAVLYIHGNRCLLRGSVEDRRIYIAIQGAQETRREALSLIRDKLEEIHRTIKGLVPIELVPIPGQKRSTVEYATLVKSLRKGITKFMPEGADEEDDPADALELLRLVDTEQRRLLYGLNDTPIGMGKWRVGSGSPRIGSLKGGRPGHEEVGMSGKRGLPHVVDFAIITMKEEEFTAVENRFEPVNQVSSARGDYLHSLVTTPDGRTHDVLIARCLEQGQSDAQQAANDLIHDANPRWILLVGIAGAYPAKEFTLGDVLLASRIYDFAVTAALEGRVVEQNPKGGGVHRKVSRLLKMIPSAANQRKLGNWNGAPAIPMPKPALKIPDDLADDAFYGPPDWKKDVQKGLQENFPGGDPRAPLYRIASIASGNTLVKDTELAAAWKNAARAVTHIEMELGGVYTAAQATDIPLLSIRGISDVVGFRRSTAWTNYACQPAAAFARALIGSGLIETRNDTPAG